MSLQWGHQAPEKNQTLLQDLVLLQTQLLT
jgi:hypothetical protein